MYETTARAFKTWGGYQALNTKETVFEKRVKTMPDDPLKLVNPCVQAAYVRVLMGGTCTGSAMKNSRNCIICQGRHEDTITRWSDCRVAKIWMELLDMKPPNYLDMTPGLRKMLFLGLTADNTNATVRLNSLCLA